MKYLNFYRNEKISKDKVFENFTKTLKESIKVWDFFVNWKKVNNNLNKINIELNLLNSLIGSSNLEKDFINLLTKYPNIVKTLP
ncbi:MAG: DpnII family type II restriction endonuclease, partial [archaeon]